MKEEWSIAALRRHLDDNLMMCHTNHERLMCRAISGKEIRERAYEIAAKRPLTNHEKSIALEFGWR